MKVAASSRLESTCRSSLIRCAWAFWSWIPQDPEGSLRSQCQGSAPGLHDAFPTLMTTFSLVRDSCGTPYLGYTLSIESKYIELSRGGSAPERDSCLSWAGRMRGPDRVTASGMEGFAFWVRIQHAAAVGSSKCKIIGTMLFLSRPSLAWGFWR